MEDWVGGFGAMEEDEEVNEKGGGPFEEGSYILIGQTRGWEMIWVITE